MTTTTTACWAPTPPGQNDKSGHHHPGIEFEPRGPGKFSSYWGDLSFSRGVPDSPRGLQGASREAQEGSTGLQEVAGRPVFRAASSRGGIALLLRCSFSSCIPVSFSACFWRPRYFWRGRHGPSAQSHDPARSPTHLLSRRLHAWCTERAPSRSPACPLRALQVARGEGGHFRVPRTQLASSASLPFGSNEKGGYETRCVQLVSATPLGTFFDALPPPAPEEPGDHVRGQPADPKIWLWVYPETTSMKHAERLRGGRRRRPTFLERGRSENMIKWRGVRAANGPLDAWWKKRRTR